jgi:transcriptional regulator with XRE-family HTH domain
MRECEGCGRSLSRYNPGERCRSCAAGAVQAGVGGPISGMHLGERLAVLRREAGLTQEGLAERAGVSSEVVRKLEQRRKHGARLSTLRALAGGLGVDVAALVSDAPPPASDQSLSAVVQASAADAARITTLTGNDLTDSLSLERSFEEVRQLAVSYNMSTAGIDQFALRKATELRGILHGMTAAYASRSQHADLYLVIGLLSAVCSQACLDLGYPEEAMTQAYAGFMMGELAGHDGLRAWLMGTRSLIARFQGRYEEALGYARDGLRFATGGTAKVRLRCGEAQTLAHMGDAAGSVNALNLAKDAREHVSSADVTDGLFTFSEAKQTYYAGSSLQWLPGEQNAKAAESESLLAIKMFQKANSGKASGDELLAHVYLGNSRLTLGEIEGSMEALRPVLDLPPSERNAWERKRMKEFASKLQRASCADSRLASSALHEISSFVQTSRK